MLIEYLSDHAGEMLRQTEGQHNRALHAEGVANTALVTARGKLKAASRRKSIVHRLLKVETDPEQEARLSMYRASRALDQATAERRALAKQVQQQSAGVAGENALASALAVLPDDWVMLRGYRNRRGETDHLLIGPRGLWAIEVKAYHARLHVHGDRWWFERLDRWGNVVDRQPATDRSGRTWARQVNEVANDLARALERARHRITINRAVMLLHERASLGRCRNPNVDLVSTSPHQLLQVMHEQPTQLSSATCRSIVQAVRDDHRRHNRGRDRERPQAG
jgi:hypothetical protein